MAAILNKFQHSIRAQLVIASAVLSTISIVIVLIFTYRIFTETNTEDLDMFLYNHTLDVASTISVNFFGDLVIEVFPPSELNKKRLFPVQRSIMQLRAADGHILARSENLHAQQIPLSEKQLRDINSKGLFFQTLHAKAIWPKPTYNTNYRVLTYSIRRSGMPPLILQVGAPMTLLEETQERLIHFFLLLVPISLIVAILLALKLTEKAYEPIRELVKQTSEIKLKDLSLRVKVNAQDKEINNLTKTLNELLSNVQNLLKSEERFIADASHQLKTPLAILHNEIQSLSVDSSLNENAKQHVQSLSQEMIRLIRLVNNLLVLAKIDAGAGQLELTTVRLDEIVMEVTHTLQKLANQKNIKIKYELNSDESNKQEIDFEILGDPDLLRSAIQALIENGIKYSSDNSEILVNLKDEQNKIVFSIQDHGPGIPENELPVLFNRFQRGENISHNSKGFGLGLSIAKRIVDAHKGTIKVKSVVNQGSIFEFEIEKLTQKT